MIAAEPSSLSIICLLLLYDNCSCSHAYLLAAYKHNNFSSGQMLFLSRTSSDFCETVDCMMRGPRACPLPISQRYACPTVHAVKQSTAPDTEEGHKYYLCDKGRYYLLLLWVHHRSNEHYLLVLLYILVFNKDTSYLRGKLLCTLIIYL
jgi:hypothetical protein